MIRREIGRIGRIFVAAVTINYVWELAASALYEGMTDRRAMWWHCFVPSLGDGVLVLLIHFAGWAAFHRPDWFVRPRLADYALMLAAGLALGIGVEGAALRLGRWAYTARMPIVPGLHVGLVPVGQMLLLPPVILWVVASWGRRLKVD